MTVYKNLRGEKRPGTNHLFHLAEKGTTRTNDWTLILDELKLETSHAFFLQER